MTREKNSKLLKRVGKNSLNSNQQKILGNSGIYQPENTWYESKSILFYIKRCSDPSIHWAEASGKGEAGKCVWKGPGGHIMKNPWHLLSQLICNWRRPINPFKYGSNQPKSTVEALQVAHPGAVDYPQNTIVKVRPRIATKGSTKWLQCPGSRGQLFTGNSCSCFLCSFELKLTALAKLYLAPQYFTSGASTISFHKCQGTQDQCSQFMLPELAQTY